MSRVEELKLMPYEEYLNTLEWAEKRAQALDRAKYRCQVCNSPDGLQVHHRTYENKGDEKPEDLTVLCGKCHGLYHSSGYAAYPVTSIRDVLEDFHDKLENTYNLSEPPGIPTGFMDLDKLLGGLQRSDFIVVASRPGIGKSAFALGIGLQAAQRWQKKVLIFSPEMSEEQVVHRLISMETGIQNYLLRLGALKEDEWPILLKATNLLANTSIFIDDTPAISVLELRAKAHRLFAEHGVDLIIIDNLQLMRGNSRSENRQQEISFISRSLKALARELNIPILALSQLSRQVESRHDKRPKLSDLRESGSIEEDADLVMFIYRDDFYDPDTEFPNIGEIIIGKNRNGPSGIFSVYFKKHLATFVDLEIKRQLLEY